MPIIITHGWPGSIIEQLKLIGPITDPTAYDGRAEDAFDVVIPSLPGYGLSGKPTTAGWDPVRIARAWVVLMKRLGYTLFVAQGGDWGNAVTEQMALLAPPELIGIHTNMPATVPADGFYPCPADPIVAVPSSNRSIIACGDCLSEDGVCVGQAAPSGASEGICKGTQPGFQ